jgi:hypothetical protein
MQWKNAKFYYFLDFIRKYLILEIIYLIYRMIPFTSLDIFIQIMFSYWEYDWITDMYVNKNGRGNALGEWS